MLVKRPVHPVHRYTPKCRTATMSGMNTGSVPGTIASVLWRGETEGYVYRGGGIGDHYPRNYIVNTRGGGIPIGVPSTRPYLAIQKTQSWNFFQISPLKIAKLEDRPGTGSTLELVTPGSGLYLPSDKKLFFHQHSRWVEMRTNHWFWEGFCYSIVTSQIKTGYNPPHC